MITDRPSMVERAKTLGIRRVRFNDLWAELSGRLPCVITYGKFDMGVALPGYSSRVLYCYSGTVALDGFAMKVANLLREQPGYQPFTPYVDNYTLLYVTRSNDDHSLIVYEPEDAWRGVCFNSPKALRNAMNAVGPYVVRDALAVDQLRY